MIGKIIGFSGSTIPAGYLVCDGSAVSRTTYASLYSVIGDSFGDGDGETTFNVPNLMDKVVVGVSSGHPFASSGGENNHVLDDTEIPAHLHSVPSHGHDNNFVFNTPSLSHSITTQPSFTYTHLNATAKTYTYTAGKAYAGLTNASMSSATSVAISDHPATACTMSGGITDCPAFDTETAGSGDAHNNMMPYIALVFLIQAEEG